MRVVALILVIAAAAAWLALMARVGLVAARLYQIEEYESRRFLRWIRQSRWVDHRSVVFAAGVAVVGLIAGIAAAGDAAAVAGAAAWLAGSAGAHTLWRWPAAKRDLAWTARMRRLTGTASVLCALVAAGTAALLTSGGRGWTRSWPG